MNTTLDPSYTRIESVINQLTMTQYVGILFAYGYRLHSTGMHTSLIRTCAIYMIINY